MSGQDICRILSLHGFEIIRQRGSHIVMQKKTSTSTITVPILDHKEIRIGTLKSIIRQSQIPTAEFET
jgi:predicted RNA binding protein YcfA (HicA-like mRNA interferase family)